MLKAHKGFTLIEIMVAMAIFGLVMLTFISVFTNSYLYIIRAGRKSNAVHNVEKELETTIAQGTNLESNNLIISFDGGLNVEVDGQKIEKVELYDGTNTVSADSFLPKESIVAKSTSESEPPLSIYATELNLRPYSTFLLEANKPVTWESTDASVAAVDFNGLITTYNTGQAIIKATAYSVKYGTEIATCIVNVKSDIFITEIPGGKYVQYEGVKYIKLSGGTARVLELTPHQLNVKQNSISSIQLPSKTELSGDSWTSTLRSEGFEYWTSDVRGNIATYVDINGEFKEKSKTSNSNHRLVVILPYTTLKVASGQGTETDPFILVE